MTRKNILLHGLLLLLLGTQTLFGIDNLKLNSNLDYQSDSLDGPLITGDDAQSGFVPEVDSKSIEAVFAKSFNQSAAGTK